MTGKAESENIAKFLIETNERWRNISVELRCIQSLLEEVISYWQKFRTLAKQLGDWLDKALVMVNLPEDEKMGFFQVGTIIIIIFQYFIFLLTLCFIESSIKDI